SCSSCRARSRRSTDRAERPSPVMVPRLPSGDDIHLVSRRMTQGSDGRLEENHPALRRMRTHRRKLAELRPGRIYHRTVRSPLPLALRPAAWDLGAPSYGPAMTVLGTIMARVVVIVRGIALAEIVVQVIIWHSFYLANPWRLTGPAAAIAWGVTTMV